MNEITAAIKKKAEEKYKPSNMPSEFWMNASKDDIIGVELNDFSIDKQREAYTCGGEDAIGFMLKFVEWAFVRGYRPRISELGNIYYHHDSETNELPKQLLLKYMETENNL